MQHSVCSVVSVQVFLMAATTHFHASGSTFAMIDEVTPAGPISTMSHTCMVLTHAYCYIL